MKVLGNFPGFGKFPVEWDDLTQDDMRILGKQGLSSEALVPRDGPPRSCT
jgi:hypothetical protein